VGAFWQPRLVWIDVKFLKTLPIRELRTGFAEIIKYGVIKDKSFFLWLESRINNNARFATWSQTDLQKAIVKSVKIKAHIVGRDERETPLAGGREILNLGHTGGHALEAAYAYKHLSHGEAISIGMNLAGCISLKKKRWSLNSHRRVLALLNAVGLPTTFPSLSAHKKGRFWQALRKDKKHVSGQLRFVLPQRIGQVVVESGIPLAWVERAVENASNSGILAHK